MPISEIRANAGRALGAALLLMMLTGDGLAQDKPLNIYVGQGQMPFADGNAEQSGLFGDLIRELCTRLARQCVFRSVPWRRVLSEAGGDEHAIVLNLGRTSEREDDFIWLLNVVPTPYVLASLQRPFHSLDEALEAGPVAVMGGTPRAVEINQARRDAQRVVEVTDPEQAAQLLESGRVVAWYEIDLRAIYLWKLRGNAVPLQFGQSLSHTQSHIAGNLDLPEADALRQQMSETFAEMRRDGSWQRILSHYLGHEKSQTLLSDGW